jgi:hypothetical protein
MKKYKASQWKTSSNVWCVGDTSDLANYSNNWLIPVKILGITPEEYVKMLVNTYKADVKFYDSTETGNGRSLLLFTFKEYAAAHKYLLYINKAARNFNG